MSAMDQWHVFGFVLIGMLAVLGAIEYLDWRESRKRK